MNTRADDSDRPPTVIFRSTHDDTTFLFECPACKEIHAFNRTWQFNDDLVKPTVTPSILVYPNPAQPRCHSFITDGKISYCSDSDHSLAGHTVDLIPWTRQGDY